MLGEVNANTPGDVSQSITNQIHDTIFRSDSAHRIPGLILFLMILIIGIFYICGRERRSRYIGILLGPGHRKARGVRAYLPLWLSQLETSHDRVMESGQELDGAMDFELLDEDSDDTKFSAAGKRRGPASPSRITRVGALSPEFLDRRGLAVRTESRERLDAVGGRKSRIGSPNRNGESMNV